ncbi:hypothetical protein [Shewanella phage FishSpeaker]|nr:hypothetical protein [Shewanella phage FishSpeaker]
MYLNTFVPSQETYANYTRPMTYDSIRRVLRFYGLEGSRQVLYMGESEITPLVGSNSTDGLRGDLFTDGIFREKIYCNVTHDRSEFNSGFSNSRRMITEQPTWYDSDTGLMVTPAFEGRICRVELSCFFPSRIKAQQFIATLSRLQANQVVDFNFETNVHVVFNEGILGLIEHIHALKSKWEPTLPTLEDWFVGCAQQPLTTITNKAGNNAVLAVPFNMQNLGIQFSEPTIALARKSDLFGKYEVIIPYFYHFQEFIGWEVQYPLSIYQDTIDEEFIPHKEEGQRPFTRRRNIELDQAKQLWDVQSDVQPYYIVLPEYDPWKMEFKRFELPIVQARLSVDNVPEQVMCNFFDIPGFTWHPALKNYVVRNRSKLFDMASSPLIVRIYSGEIMILNTQLRMEENGDIILNRPPTMKNIHHLVVSLDYGVRDWPDSFWEDIDMHPEDRPVLDVLFPWFDWSRFPNNLAGNANLIRELINQGDGIIHYPWGHYMMRLGLHAHSAY